MENITSFLGYNNSLQIVSMGNIPAGSDFELSNGISNIFLVKNISEENITVTAVPAAQDTPITTVLYPGWNVEIFKKIINVETDQLQYGY